MKSVPPAASTRFEGEGPTSTSTLGEIPFLLTVQEAAMLLRTSRKAIYCLIERGQLAGIVRVGRRVLLRRDVLLRSLDENSNAVAGK